jgi:hypothetical protein
MERQEMGRTAALIRETVGEVSARHPQTVGIFRRFGLDVRQHARTPVAVAAGTYSADPAQLVAQLLLATRVTR